MKKKLSILFAMVLTITSFKAQNDLRIVGVDPVLNIIKIENTGTTTLNIMNHQLCANFAYTSVGSLTVVSGSATALASGTVVTLSGMALTASGSDLGLYIAGTTPATFGNAANMIDFVQWGSGGNGRESVAVTKGIWSAGDFISGTPIYTYVGNGTTNNGVTFWRALSTIVAVQTPGGGFSADTSQLFGQIVAIKGIVTGKKSNGYFVQNGTAPFSGIFVFNSTNNPSVGDDVTLSGTVTEFFNLTQITSVVTFCVNSTGNTLPTPASLSTLAVNNEQYEGMLVKVSNATSTGAPNGFGEWEVNDGSGPVVIDDAIFPFVPAVGTNYDVTGPLDFNFGAFKILPRTAADVVGQTATTPFVSIFDIQFTTAPSGDSPQNGNVVKTKGVVTGVVNFGTASAVGTFFIQDGNGAWNGIYVFNNATTVAIGDSVEVTGEVDEFNGTTELINVTNITILNSGNTLPTPAIITTSAANMEEWEGVLIQVKNAVYVNNPGQFGLWNLNDGSGIIQADDDIFPYANIATVGSTYDVTGIGHFSFGAAKILPRSINDISLSTSIDELEKIAVAIYPNPAKDVLTFELGINSFEITITDITGKTIKTLTSTNNKKVINVAELNNGVYFYTIITNGNVVSTNKFIVAK